MVDYGPAERPGGTSYQMLGIESGWFTMACGGGQLQVLGRGGYPELQRSKTANAEFKKAKARNAAENTAIEGTRVTRNCRHCKRSNS